MSSMTIFLLGLATGLATGAFLGIAGMALWVHLMMKEGKHNV